MKYFTVSSDHRNHTQDIPVICASLPLANKAIILKAIRVLENEGMVKSGKDKGAIKDFVCIEIVVAGSYGRQGYSLFCTVESLEKFNETDEHIVEVNIRNKHSRIAGWRWESNLVTVQE